MKSTIFNTRVFAMAIAAFLTLAVINPALANDEKNAIPVELKFIGNIENQPVFQLNFSNAEESEFTIVVRDENHNILYRDVVKGAKINRKFLLNMEDLGDTAIQFEITGKKTGKSVVYEVNKKSRLVQDVVISKKN